MQPEGDAAKTTSVSELIAWLSVCMLAASWATTFDPSWGRCWAIFGAFGLTSALGMDVLKRSQQQRQIRARNRRTTRRAERNLDKEIDGMESSTAVRFAVVRLKQSLAKAQANRRHSAAQPGPPSNDEVTLTRLYGWPKVVCDRMAESVAGRLRGISRQGAELVHDRRIERGLVLLACPLDPARQVHFIADVLWCELQNDGRYFSRAKLIDVLTTEDARAVVAGQPASA